MIWNIDDAEANPWRRRGLISVLVVLAVISAYVWWPRFKTYPEVTSKQAMDLMKLLYAACNTKDPARLTKVEQGLQAMVKKGSITEKEQQAFADIIKMAKAGEWKAAEQASFRFAQQQVR